MIDGRVIYEYKVEISPVRKAEKLMNERAEAGWRVVSVSPNIAACCGVVITFEREKK